MQTDITEKYKAFKEKHPDAVILFRQGEFYTFYHDDAKTVAEILGIIATRINGKTFFAAFPKYALDTYLPKLIRAGRRVAIVEP